MYISVFSDEMGLDFKEALPIYAEWGLKHVDFRALINGKGIHAQTNEELREIKAMLDGYGMKATVLQSSLCKVHLPDEARVRAEMEKLDGLIRASEILDCNMVRSFNFWQHKEGEAGLGDLAMRPDELERVMDMFTPFVNRAREAGLIFGIENCGQTPDEVIALLEAYRVPGWGLAWDVANMFETLPEAQGDCIEYFTKALKYANMVHVKARSILPEIENKKVPWDRVLRGVAATGKDMPVSIETHNPPTSPLTKIEATKRVYDEIKKVWPASAPPNVMEAIALKPKFERPYKDNPVNMVVVGLGMGKNRCAQIVDTSGIRLYGVCDINESRAKEVGEQFGVPYSSDINVFLNDPAVEAMYIVTPTGLHCSIAEQCMNAGKHVLVTKPMDVCVENCDRAIALAKEKGLMLGVDYDLHYRGPLTELKKAVDEGWFGKILAVNVELNIKRTPAYFKQNGGWRGTWALDGGGAMSNQGIHEIDRVLTILGQPKRVRASIATQTFDIEAEDFGSAEWEYENGCRVRFMVSTSYVASSWYTRIELHGTDRAYLLCQGGPEGNHIYWFDDNKWSEEPPFPIAREWQQGSDNFAYCLRMGTEPVVGYPNGRNARYVLDKMYESAKNGEGWIEI